MLGCIASFATLALTETVNEKRAHLMRSVPQHGDDDKVENANLIATEEEGTQKRNSESESADQSARRVLASLEDATVSELHAEFKQLAADDRKHAATLREGILLRQKLKDEIVGLISRLEQENRRVSKLLPKSEQKTNRKEEARHHHGQQETSKRNKDPSGEDDPHDQTSEQDEDTSSDGQSLAELSDELQITPQSQGSLEKDVEDGRIATAGHVDGILSYIHHLHKRDDAQLIALRSNAKLRKKIKTRVQRRISEQESELASATSDEEAALPDSEDGTMHIDN